MTYTKRKTPIHRPKRCAAIGKSYTENMDKSEDHGFGGREFQNRFSPRELALEKALRQLEDRGCDTSRLRALFATMDAEAQSPHHAEA
jgi:hypothetical protein